MSVASLLMSCEEAKKTSQAEPEAKETNQSRIVGAYYHVAEEARERPSLIIYEFKSDGSFLLIEAGTEMDGEWQVTEGGRLILEFDLFGKTVESFTIDWQGDDLILLTDGTSTERFIRIGDE